MPLITLVRHAQASFGSANYDQLSELGYQQSRWLGEYMAQTGQRFDRVITGSQARHRQTADTLLEAAGCSPAWQEDARWNEFNFQQLVRCFLNQQPEREKPDPRDARQMLQLLKCSLLAWAAGELQESELPETWQQFEQRLAGALADLGTGSDRQDNILIVSSGGAIAMALRQILKAAPETMVALNLQTANTAMHQCRTSGSGLQLTSFNHLPHLSARTEHITFF